MGQFVTGETARERFRELLGQVDAAYDEMRSLSSDGVGNEFRVQMAEHLETQERTNRGLMYQVFGEIADPPDEVEYVPVLAGKLCARLRIPPREIKRRIKVAGRIRPRRQLTGPPLAPELPRVAQALEAGTIGEDHLRAICRAIDVLPSCVSAVDREDVERSLVREATKNDVEIVKAAARRIDEIFNPDGDTTRPTGRAAAVRPGRHLPDGTLVEVADDRSPAQRCHDGIKLALKAGIGSGAMGSHRGHPVTVIVRTTLAELNQAAHAVTNRMSRCRRRRTPAETPRSRCVM